MVQMQAAPVTIFDSVFQKKTFFYINLNPVPKNLHCCFLGRFEFRKKFFFFVMALFLQDKDVYGDNNSHCGGRNFSNLFLLVMCLDKMFREKRPFLKLRRLIVIPVQGQMFNLYTCEFSINLRTNKYFNWYICIFYYSKLRKCTHNSLISGRTKYCGPKPSHLSKKNSQII